MNSEKTRNHTEDTGGKKRDGLSLRTVYVLLIIGAVIISILVFYATFHMSAGFRRLTEASERQIELRKAARELTDSSDYLTEKVQRFTVEGDLRFLDEYFAEAFESKHREEAVSIMAQESGSAVAVENLQAAMNGSLELMSREYYAMKLVIEAKGYTDYPDTLRSVGLTSKDRSLSAEDKMRLATEMVLDDVYYAQKDQIREHMRVCLDELERMAYDLDAEALESLRGEMNLVRAIIAVQTLGIIFMVWLTSRLGIHPILNAVNRIKDDSPIPEVGANEFRYLARAYNKMYEVYRKSIERLNFKASHDELTGAYNRAGYDLLISSVDLKTTYMMLIDIDNFKEINDTYGHEVGDRALKKLVDTLSSNFRAEDYVCRIGGDEFAVFMIHADKSQRELVASKIEHINRELEQTEDGLPPISISVGVVHGSDAGSAEEMLEKSDEAMYKSKASGKHTYSFFPV